MVKVHSPQTGLQKCNVEMQTKTNHVFCCQSYLDKCEILSLIIYNSLTPPYSCRSTMCKKERMAGFKYKSQVLTKNIPYVNNSLQKKICGKCINPT